MAIPLFDWHNFMKLLLMHVAGLAMSDKPVSIEPANASSDETKPEIELKLLSEKPSLLFGNILDSKWMRRASQDHLTVQRSGSQGWKHFQSL